MVSQTDSPEERVRALYRHLLRTWGPQDWWPAHSRFEVILGAYLTQNTAWVNVEHALRKLRQKRALNLARVRRMPLQDLERAVRSSGYFRQKALKIKRFVEFLDRHYGGSLQRLFSQPTEELRKELLALHGVGPETADSILLYAGGHPVFVVDAYTRRVFDRHGILPAHAPYEQFRHLVERALADEPPVAATLRFVSPFGERRRHKFVLARAAARASVFNEFHALLVQVAKHRCRKADARCQACPLERFLDPAQGKRLPG